MQAKEGTREDEFWAGLLGGGAAPEAFPPLGLTRIYPAGLKNDPPRRERNYFGGKSLLRIDHINQRLNKFYAGFFTEHVVFNQNPGYKIGKLTGKLLRVKHKLRVIV